jgi:hypothetical protein
MSDDQITEPETDETPRSRRDLLAKGTVAAAVAAVAGTALSKSAHAADGDNLRIGLANTGSSTTALSGGTTFRVSQGTSAGAASIYGLASGDTNLYGVRGDRSGADTGGAGVFGVASGDEQKAIHGRATGSQGVGVYGEITGTGGTGVYGIVSGSTVSGVGVRGEVTFGTGVAGVATSGTGVTGNGTTFDVRAVGSGRIGLAASSPSATANGAVGTIARDGDGSLWYCYATNRWRRLAGSSTAGSFVPLTPFRAYDSRRPQPQQGKIAANQTRTLSVKDARSVADGTVTTADVVPAGATAVAFNITVVNTEANGYLYVADGGATSIAASTINWPAANTVVANSAIVKLDATRQIKVFCGETGATNFIIDVAGYYL